MIEVQAKAPEKPKIEIESNAPPSMEKQFSMSPCGPVKQELDLNLDLLKPIYDIKNPEKVDFEMPLVDNRSRVGRTTTLCYLATCQGFAHCLCMEEVCKEFCQISLLDKWESTKNWCCGSRSGVHDLPASIEPVIDNIFDPEAPFGRVYIVGDKLVMEKMKGIQKHITTIPLLAIQKMQILEVDPGMNYGFVCCKAKIRCCPLADSVEVLKLFGKDVSTYQMVCGKKCELQKQRTGLALLFAKDATLLMAELKSAIEKEMERRGVKKPHGNAFTQVVMRDPYGQLFTRGSIIITGEEGQVALPANAMIQGEETVSGKHILFTWQGPELREFLKSRGWPHDNTDTMKLEELRDRAYDLWSSQFGERYSEFETDPERACCRCGKSAPKSSAPWCARLNIPRLPLLDNPEPKQEDGESPAEYAIRLAKEAAMERLKELVKQALMPVPVVGQIIIAKEQYDEVVGLFPSAADVLERVCFLKCCCAAKSINMNEARDMYVWKAGYSFIDRSK